MEFLERADYRVIGLGCAICDSPIELTHAVFFDVDGQRDADGHDQTRITCHHAWCHRYMLRAQAAARAAALLEAAQSVKAEASTSSAYDLLMVRVRQAQQQVIEAAA